jgi:hypothetical protein
MELLGRRSVADRARCGVRGDSRDDLLSHCLQSSSQVGSHGSCREIDHRGDLRGPASAVVPEHDCDPLLFGEVLQHVPQRVSLWSEIHRPSRCVLTHHPAMPKCRPTPADHDGSQISTWLSQIGETSRDLHEGILHDLLGLCVAPDERVCEPHHCGVFRSVQVLERGSGPLSDCRALDLAHTLHHPYGARATRSVAAGA